MMAHGRPKADVGAGAACRRRGKLTIIADFQLMAAILRRRQRIVAGIKMWLA